MANINNLVKSDQTPDEELEQMVQSASLSIARSPNGSAQISGTARDWYTMMLAAERQGLARFRSTVARALTKHYPHILDPANDNSDVSILMDGSIAYQLNGVAESSGFPLVETEYEPSTLVNPPKTAPARQAKVRDPKPCECGCGGMTGGGRFIPGHDSKMKSRLLQEFMDESTRDAAREQLISRGWSTDEKLDAKLQKEEAKVAAAIEREAAKAAAREEKAKQKAEADRLKAEAEGEATIAA